ncbi:MAG: LysR substrate-binding domain-containing protein [Bacteroidales bacterium]|nr:LysR substrate-binding domain-containing protein [Bacteroidales bacterium]
MELRQLRYFLKAAELQNFTEASKSLFIAQSTLSQQINQLENELGILLFDRIGKRLFLTEAGKEFVPFAKQTIQDAELGKQRLLDLQGLKTGSLRVGITYSLSFGLASILQRFIEEYPQIKLEIVYSTASELLEMLSSRDIDFVLSFKTIESEDAIEMTELFEVSLCAVVHYRHPMAFRKEISLKELQAYSLALPSKGLNARAMFDKLLHENDIVLEPRLEMNDANFLLQLVEKSMFATVLSQAAILGRKDLKAIPIKEQKEKMMASLLTLKGAYQKKSAKAFIRLYEEELQMSLLK